MGKIPVKSREVRRHIQAMKEAGVSQEEISEMLAGNKSAKESDMLGKMRGLMKKKGGTHAVRLVERGR